jgi:hypothetical protein
MKSRVPAAAAALLLAGAVAGCAHTVTGTVAMTTEPGASSTSTPRTSTPRTSTPGTSTPRTPSDAPPGDAQSVTCGEFVKMDPSTQASVIDEILGEFGPSMSGDNAEAMRIAADAMCQILPKDVVLNDILMGGSPP